MKNLILALVITAVVVAGGYAVYTIKQPANLGTYGGDYQIVLGAAGLPSHLASSTEPLGNEIFVGRTADKITLMLQAQASTTATALKIVPQVSRDCATYYDWHTPTSTLVADGRLLATTSILWYLPADANSVTTTDAWTFSGINAECMKFLIYKGLTGEHGNARLYGEAYIHED